MTIEGFGIGLRTEFATELVETDRALDWLEIIPENWIDIGGRRRRDLEQCGERWQLVPHSVSMSIGGPSPLNADLFRGVTELCEEFDSPFWSDHVCYSNVGGKDLHDLFPLPFSKAALEHVLRRLEVARTMTDVPIILENPTFYATMPGTTMSEADFLNAIVAQSGCGLLLDVNNVYVNSQNHGFDPVAFIDAMPLDAVRQIHVAGHTRLCHVIVDTHIGPTPDAVWDLYRHTIRRAGRVIPTLIEWDAKIPPLDVLLDELDRARREAAAALAPAASAVSVSEAAGGLASTSSTSVTVAA